jgi:glucose/arabinose dehydrogenase
MLRFGNWGILVGILALVTSGSANAAITGLKRVATGLSAPIFVTHAPGDRTRLFIVQRGGSIRILNLTTGALEATPFLTIPSVDQGGEGGLLGMAFHPDYATNGKFYVNVTIDNGGLVFQGATSPFSTRIREYTVSANPNVANTAPTEILSFIQPQDNHNAGWIGFSPNNGLLYIPTGDGGGGGDTGSGHTGGSGNAQDFSDNLLGKILRIDVDADDFPGDANRNYAIPVGNPYRDTVDDMGMPVVVPGDDEIWAIGMRNPFRDSFDRLTGDLWLGDVGQGSREEIDRGPAGATGGDNFGWRLCEGNICPSPPANYRPPVYDYNRDADEFGGSVVTGGYVYRGPDPSLQGKYFFLDSRNSSATTDDNYWRFDTADPVGSVENIDSLLVPDVGTVQFPVSFGEDAVGNLYIAYLSSGNVFRIATNDLLPGDYDADGKVDNADYAVWQADFGSTTNLDADGNGDNVVDAADYTVWRDNFGNSVHNLGAGSGGVGAPEPAALALVGQITALLLLRVRRRGNIE